MATPIPTSEARRRIAEITEDAAFRGRRFLLRRHGRPLAALISAEDLAKLETLEAVMDLEAIRKSLAEPGEDLAWTQLRRELAEGSQGG